MSHKPLSPRENQIVKLAAGGLTDREIAESIGIGVASVKTYWTRIRNKTLGRNRTQIVFENRQSEPENPSQ